MRDVELRLPADVQYVGLARLVVTVAARQAGMADERVEDLKIAVSEATTNAITAHRHDEPSLPVVLTFGPVGRGQFSVSIADAAVDADGPDAALDDWAADTPLGVTLIRGLADDVEFRTEVGNVVHMRFGVSADDTTG
jgi:serine/threonine-protein kinase RsbW